MGYHCLVENGNLRGHFKPMVCCAQTSGIKSFADFEIVSVSFLEASREGGGVVEVKV